MYTYIFNLSPYLEGPQLVQPKYYGSNLFKPDPNTKQTR